MTDSPAPGSDRIEDQLLYVTSRTRRVSLAEGYDPEKSSVGEGVRKAAAFVVGLEAGETTEQES